MKITRFRDMRRKYLFLPIVTLVTVSTVLVSAFFIGPILAPFIFHTLYKHLQYENSTYGIRMQYLSTWQPESHFNATDTRFVVFQPLNQDRAYFFLGVSSIRHLKADEGNSPPSLSNTSSPSAGDTIWYPISNASSTLAGRPAYDLAYWGSNGSGVFDVKEVGTVVADKEYYVQYVAVEETYPQYVTTVQDMLRSLEIVNSGKISYR